jgi:GNAT superfamily N-acetyltransferase
VTLDLAFTTRPTKAERDAVGRGLAAHNRASHPRKLRGGERWFFLKDAAGTILAGAKCDQAWDWLYIDWLWVAEGHRRQGLGGRLLAAAEAFAREKGLTGLHLHTWSFQAPDYYPRHGFTEAGRIADMPEGVVRHWFAKRF